MTEVENIAAFVRRAAYDDLSRITVRLQDRSALTREKQDYEGFVTHLMAWNTVIEKIKTLSQANAGAALQ